MKKRNGVIDFMKFIFTVLVVAAHLWSGYLSERMELRIRGHISVEFFFICSGFLLAVWCEKRIKEGNVNVGLMSRDFIFGKFAGLYPTYFVSLCAYIVWQMIKKPLGIKEFFYWITQNVSSFLMVFRLGFGEDLVVPYSWYLSALLVISLVVCACVLHWKDTWYYVIAPTVLVFGGAYIFYNWGKILVLANEDTWIGWTYASIIRGVIGITLGTVSFKMTQRIKQLENKLTQTGVCLFSLCEFLCFLIPILFICIRFQPKHTMLIPLLFAVGVSFAFSGIGLSARVFQSPVFNWLGKYSYALYLAQWIPYNCLRKYYNTASNLEFFVVYMIMALIAGLVLHYLTIIFQIVWKKFMIWMRNVMFIEQHN